MPADEQELVAGFLNGLARQRVIDFLSDVAADEALMIELAQIDLYPEPVAAFARSKGYGFTADELTAVIEARIAHDVSQAEREVRDRLIRQRAESSGSGAVRMDGTVHAQLIEAVHRPGFTLDRKSILRGDVLALRQVPALPALLALMDENIGAAFDGTDLEQLHRHFCYTDLKARSDVAYANLLSDDRIPGAVGAVIADLGLDVADILWEWPGMRLLYPEASGGRGVYRTAKTGALAPHRDTWYGSPQHQINLWGPIRRLDPDSTLRICTGHFLKTVANSSHGYDTWQNRCGLALPPSLLADISVDAADVFAPPLEIGDVMCFAGHQLHGSAMNHSDRTRVSFEFRLLHREDEGQDYLPPNVDYYGIGEVYTGWYDARRRHVNRLTGEVTSR